MGDHNTPEHPGGVAAPAGCNKRWPHGTHPGQVNLSLGTNCIPSVATVAGWPRAQGPGRTPGLCHCPRSRPLARLHFLLVGRQRAVRGINFSSAVGKFMGLIKQHASLRAPRAQSCCRDGAAVTPQHGVPPHSLWGGDSAPRGGWPAGAAGLAALCTAPEPLVFLRRGLVPLIKSKHRNEILNAPGTWELRSTMCCQAGTQASGGCQGQSKHGTVMAGAP